MTTFLFTDIIDSTRLWEQDPVRMGAMMREHDSVIEDAAATNGGSVVRPRGEGDSRFVVFDHPASALAAALQIHQALGSSQLEVRIGVHAGVASYLDGDYYGPDVNRCARLRGLASGGQVLVSEAAAVAARSSLPSGASLRRVGILPLRGCSEPELAFALEHPSLSAPRPLTRREQWRRLLAFIMDEVLSPQRSPA